MSAQKGVNQSIPTTTKQWTVVGQDGLHSLRYSEEPVPEHGDNEVLVKSEFLSVDQRSLHRLMKTSLVQGASLNVCLRPLPLHSIYIH